MPPSLRPLAPLSSRTLVVTAGVCLALATGSCKKASAPPAIAGLTLAPVDEARRRLLATVSLPSFDGTVEETAALAKHLDLPFGDAELRGLLSTRLGIPPELAAHLDTRKAIGAAMIARAPHESPFVAIAAETRSPEAVAKLAAAIGTRAGAQQDAVQLRRPDGTSVWLLSRGTTVVASDSLDGLVAAGSYALLARQRGREDVVVSLFPEALEQLRQKLAQGTRDVTAKRGHKLTPGERASVDAGLAPLVDRIADSASADVVLDVDRGRGVALGVRATPRPGSAFARELGTFRPHSPDPAIAAGEAPSVFLSIGANRSLLDAHPRYLDALAAARVSGAADLAKAERALAERLTGKVSLRATLQPEASTYDLAAEMAPGAAPSSALDALSGVLGHPALQTLLDATMGRNAVRVRWKRTGLEGRAETALAAQADADARRAIKALHGSDVIVSHTTAVRDRLLFATGAEAQGRVRALASYGTAGQMGPPLAALAAEAKGAAGFAYVDLLAVARAGLVAASGRDAGAAQISMMMGAVPGLAALKLPIVLTWTGGTGFASELRVPLGTLTSAATFARPFIGMGALGGFGGPPR